MTVMIVETAQPLPGIIAAAVTPQADLSYD